MNGSVEAGSKHQGAFSQKGTMPGTRGVRGKALKLLPQAGTNDLGKDAKILVISDYLVVVVLLRARHSTSYYHDCMFPTIVEKVQCSNY